MLVFVAIAAPVLVAGIAVAFEEWLPLGDLAAMVFQVSRVGTRDTPLVGPYSARFSHPGPLLFWVGAIPYRLAGSDPRALLVFAASVNAASVVVIGWVTGRIGGRTLQVLAALAVALLLHDLGTDLLVQPWNPFIAALPFLVLLCCAWAGALGSRRALFGCAVLGAWVVQAHIGYVPLFVVVSVWLAGWLVLQARRTRARPAPGPPLARPLGGAIALFCMLMLPALIDQVFGRQNLSALWRAFVTSPQSRIGVEDATGIVSRFLQPFGPWIGTEVPLDFGGAMVGAGAWSLVLVWVLLGGLLAAAWRRGRIDVAVPVSLALALDLAAVPVASRISPPALEYLLLWLHPLGAFTWLVIVWGLVRLVPWPEVLRRVAPAARVVAAAAAMAVAATMVPSALEPTLPDAPQAPTVRAVLDQLAEATQPGPDPVRVDVTGDTFGQATAGIVYDLIRRGLRVRTDIGRDQLVWNEEHRLQPDGQTDSTLTIVVTTARPAPGAPPRRCSDDPAQRRIADASAASSPGDGTDDLVERVYRVEVYEGPAPCVAPAAGP